MVAGMSRGMDTLECWVTIEFKKYPDGENLRDVMVRFTSPALENTAAFDWKYIATHDVISRGFMKGFDPNDQSSPDEKPPLNVPVKVKYPLHAKHKLDLSPGETISLEAELFWAGKKVDSDSRSIEHAYTRQMSQ
jgi:hypothetical protein